MTTPRTHGQTSSAPHIPSPTRRYLPLADEVVDNSFDPERAVRLQPGLRYRPRDARGSHLVQAEVGGTQTAEIVGLTGSTRETIRRTRMKSWMQDRASVAALLLHIDGWVCCTCRWSGQFIFSAQVGKSTRPDLPLTGRDELEWIQAFRKVTVSIKGRW